MTVITPTKEVGWFSAERRQQIQATLVALVPLAILFGYGTEGVWEQVLIISGALLGAFGSLLSLVNVRVADWATEGWKIARGAIYAAGTVISPALMALGFYNDEVNTQIVTGISLALTALSSAIAIFANGQQQKAAAVELAQGTDGTWRLTEGEKRAITEIRARESGSSLN